VEDYIALRQRLGTKFLEGARLLRAFAAFADAEGAVRVATDVALRWACGARATALVSAGPRLRVVRAFAQWRRATDPVTEVPPADLLPVRYRRRPPYLYTDSDLGRLLQAARDLPSAGGLDGLTYGTLFGLLIVTGMRISEAVALERLDVDIPAAVLTIRRTKFGKSRLVPLEASAVDALSRYAMRRDQCVPQRRADAFFVSETGVAMTAWKARHVFVRLSAQIGLRPPVHGHRYGHGPRLHDLRHRFAVRTLIDWYRAGENVEARLPYLATYLGHVHANETYWYLEAVPELLQLVTERLRDRRNSRPAGDA
jgi:integrase